MCKEDVEQMRRKRQSGYTMVEMVVVLGLLGLTLPLLAAILYQLIWIPGQKSDTLTVLHNVRQASVWITSDARQAITFAPGTEPDYGTFSWVDRSSDPAINYAVRYYYSSTDMRLMREETGDGGPQTRVIAGNIAGYSDISIQETEGMVLVDITATKDSVRDTIIRTASVKAQMRTLLPVAPPEPPPFTLTWDDFESGGWTGGGTGWLGSWYSAGDASIVSTNTPYQGTYHLQLRRATGYVDRSLDLSGQSNVRLQFWARAYSFEAGETAKCRVSPDGTTWYTVRTWVDGQDDNIYHFEDIDLSSYSMTSEFWIAFEADMADTGDYLWIDDMKVVTTW